MIYRLKKTLHGLKQQQRARYGILGSYLMKYGFDRNENKHILYVK